MRTLNDPVILPATIIEELNLFLFCFFFNNHSAAFVSNDPVDLIQLPDMFGRTFCRLYEMHGTDEEKNVKCW